MVHDRHKGSERNRKIDANANDADSDERVNAFDVATPAASATAVAGIVASAANMAAKTATFSFM